MPVYVERVFISGKAMGTRLSDLVDAGVFDGMTPIMSTKHSLTFDFSGDAGKQQRAVFDQRLKGHDPMILCFSRIQYSRQEIESASWVAVSVVAGIVCDDLKLMRDISQGECSACGVPAKYLDLPECDLLPDESEMVLHTNSGEWFFRREVLPESVATENPIVLSQNGGEWVVLRNGVEFPKRDIASTGIDFNEVCKKCLLSGFYNDCDHPVRIVYPKSIENEMCGSIGFSKEWDGERIENEHLQRLPSRTLYLSGKLASMCFEQDGVKLDIIQFE